ncbi:MAG: alpha/beta fold hydrolase [Gammaproteobacteria bacterium]|nr:alpha/beta fold hydrolase [Gammaproteobacteria bacterium]
MSDITSINHKIIGQIYDAAIEPTLWPELLVSLSEGLDEILVGTQKNSHIKAVADLGALQSDNHSYEQSIHSDALGIIASHIGKAIEISEKLDNSVQVENSYRLIFERLPIPTFIINEQLGLVSQNRLADDFLQNQQDISVQDNLIQFRTQSLAVELKNAIKTLSEETGKNSVSIRLSDHNDTKPGSLLISRAQLGSDNNSSNNYLILIASPSIPSEISLEFLTETYGLTPREAEVAIQIAASKTPKEIANQNNTSINTVRAQIKSIYLKTDVSRQSELVKLILTSPFLAQRISDNDYNDQPHDKLRPSLNRTILLSDGRTLGFAEYGDIKGEPVFVFHPSTGSRLQAHPNDEIARSLGARLIIPDRPGFGLSSPLPGRTLSDWPDDVEQLASQLGIERFSIVGFCGGAPYALSCGQKSHKRIKHVSIVSGVTPFDNINLLHGVNTTNRILLKAATLLPNSLFNLVSIIIRGMVNDPAQYLDQLHGHLCKTDSDALSEPDFLENFISALGEALRQGPRSFSEEQILFSREWEFKPRDVKTPVTLWHGGQDQHVSVQLAERLGHELPNSHSFILPNYGHFLIYHRWRDILSHHLAQLAH